MVRVVSSEVWASRVPTHRPTYVEGKGISGGPAIQPASSHALAESRVTKHKAEVDAFSNLVCLHACCQAVHRSCYLDQAQDVQKSSFI